ncbi:hypothetical protein GW17_00041913 [Ensete ventricosum]|nr:hypothetical protein GW17_00041913 [Ensete ventricosum]
MSSSSAAFSLDHLAPPPSEQLCYVHCNFCDTVLAVTHPSPLPIPSRLGLPSHCCYLRQVSVPYTSLFKTVTVRCGHCTNLLSVNMRGLLLPAANQLHLSHACLTPAHHNLLVRTSPAPALPSPPSLLPGDELQCPPPSLLLDPSILCSGNANNGGNLVHSTATVNHNDSNCSTTAPVKGAEEELPRSPVVNRREIPSLRFPGPYHRFPFAHTFFSPPFCFVPSDDPVHITQLFTTIHANISNSSKWLRIITAFVLSTTVVIISMMVRCAAPEKRQRVPSAYNRFIKDEIQRIKAGNPDITHREAFSAAAKNGLKKASVRQAPVSEGDRKATTPEGEDVLPKEGFYATAAANMGVTPF